MITRDLVREFFAVVRFWAKPEHFRALTQSRARPEPPDKGVMADNKSLGVLALVAALAAAGGGFFLFQQYSERAAAQEQSNAARDQRVRLVSDYSRACSDMGAAATVMTREVRRYLNNLNNPKVNVSGKVVTDSMEKFVLQLVTLQGIGDDLAPTIDLTFESCPTPKGGGSSFEASFEASVARAECEVNLCNQMREKMSRHAQ